MLSLRPYQNKAADFLYENDRAMILAPVGAGKTAITLTAMAELLRDGIVKRFLVLAPKRVCTDVWPVEAPKWAQGMELAICIGTPAQRVAALNSSANVVVTNYDNLQWLAEQKLNFDGIVFDELTKLKNPSGARFKALNKVLDCKVRWGLTGSFTSNGLEDVFGQCKIVNQDLLGRAKGAFMQQYFVLINKDFGEWKPRPESLELVMHRIKPATFVLDAGLYKDKLPELHTVEVRCDMQMDKYKEMKQEFVSQFPTAKVIAANAAVVTGKLQQMASGFIYDTAKFASAAPGKFSTTQTPIWFSTHKFDRLDELLQENQRANTIIAYTYKEELAELKRRYPRSVTLDDDKAIERWNAGTIELLLVHPKSAGHGLNLQHGGSRMVFLSLPWSLELYEQTIGRLHRSGQKHDVWCYVMLTNKTVDERIYASLHDKRAISNIAMEELK
jgi:SNF2 family DNA or RNA helicase